MKNLMRFGVAVLAMLNTLGLFAQEYNITLRSTMEFQGQTLANICGYAQDGREYALLGASQGLIIVDVTNPDAPVNIKQVPGPNNLWKEIKVYSHYAYVTSEGGQGVQIVDLSGLPNPNVTYHNYKGDGAISGQLNTIHALHIDVTKGYLYLYGSNLFGGGGVVCDLNADPYNPVYVGKYDANGYIHDGYVDNDTLYACHIYTGLLSMVDMHNKQAPVVLGTVETPGAFTHNSWLMKDRKKVLTTDEEYPSFVTAYDVSDPTDIKELDRISTGDGNNSIGHNTHVLGNYAITSWYIDGFTIVDATRPDNLVLVGRYDTWAQGGDFNGCWGVYPYLPSGTIVASNIPNTNGGVGKLFVCSPNYVRACYVEGVVKNGCTGQGLNNATVEIVGAPIDAKDNSDFLGVFKTGTYEPGTYTVKVSKTGYVDQEFTVTLSPGDVTTLNLTLSVDAATDANVTVINDATLAPIAQTSLVVFGNNQQYIVQTDANGVFNLTCIPAGTYQVAGWGYLPGSVDITTSGQISVNLVPGYYDDFTFDLGWTSSGNATSGEWERGEPVGTQLTTQQLANPDADVQTDYGDQCYTTGNGGGQAGTDDVDNGSVTLTSPVMKLSGAQDAILTFYYWFVNGGGQGTPPNDKVQAVVTNGSQTVTVFQSSVSDDQWVFSGEIHLKNFITLNDNVKVQFISGDDDPGHVVEAAVDVFKVVPVTTSGTQEYDATANLTAYPNPSGSNFMLQYDWKQAGSVQLEVRNLLGQIQERQPLSDRSGAVRCGDNWPAGAYLARLIGANGQSMPVKLVKE